VAAEARIKTRFKTRFEACLETIIKSGEPGTATPHANTYTRR